METNGNAIAALERVLLTVEAELTALHTGQAVDRAELEHRLLTDLTTREPEAVPQMPQMPPPPAPTAVPSTAVASTVPPAALRSTVPPLKARKTGVGFEQIFRIGGISLVVLAAVFFVSTAISRGWVGPTAQLVSATVASLLVIGQSFRFSDDRRPWTKTFAIGGLASLFATGVVGHFGLDLLDINLTLGWLGVTVVSFLGLGRVHDSQTVAAAGAPAAVIGTLLFAATSDAPPLIILALAVCWGIAGLVTTHAQRWFLARAFAGAATGFIVLVGVSLGAVTTPIVVASALGIATVVAYAAVQLRDFGSGENATDGLARLEARIAAVTTPWLALVLAVLIAGDISMLDSVSDDVGALAVGVGVAVAAAATVFSKQINATMVMLHQLAGIGTASIGFITILDGPVLIAALLSQAIITGALANKTKAVEMAIGSALLMSVTTLWSTWKILSAIGDSPMTLAEVIVTGLTVATLGAGAYLVRNSARLEHLWIAVWFGFLIWVIAVFQGVPQTQAAISLAWAFSSVALLVIPRMLTESMGANRFRTLLNVALGTLLLTGGKLIFVDLVSVDVLWRAALFLLIGATFMRLAFVLPGIVSGNDDESGEAGPASPPQATEFETTAV